MSKLKLPENHPYKDGRVCTECKQFKPANQYALERDKRAFGGITMRSKCRPCNETVKYKAFIKRTYGITYEDYEEMLTSQKGCCAICKSKISSSRTSRLYVDHCHDTMKVRGLLCSSCNHGLGLFKDSPSILKRAIDYLESGKE
jgi:hypothetical protein